MRFDTVIVGAGSCGAILASRLSEISSRSVCLIEAGPHFKSPEDLPTELDDSTNPSLDRFTWNKSASYVKEADESKPYPIGRAVGGSSLVNGAVAMRASESDIKAWQAFTDGNATWSWSNVRETYRQLESDTDYENSEHAYSGPVTIGRVPESEWPPLFDRIISKWMKEGVPYCPDQNSSKIDGVGPVPRNEVNNKRESSAFTHLRHAILRPNLTLLAETEVVEVMIEGQRAAGVVARGSNGHEELISCRQVILSAGAIGTPVLMFKSGLGPEAMLADVGIEAKVDLPGVGRNLQEHPRVPILLTPTSAKGRQGILAVMRYASSAGRELDMAVFLSQMTPQGIGRNLTDSNAVMMSCVVARPTSIGWLVPRRSQSDGLDVDIELNLLDTPEDQRRLREVVTFAASTAWSNLVREEWSKADLPEESHLKDRQYMDRWILQRLAVGYHPVGSCRIGSSSDNLAVVDERLSVREIEDLFIVDASVIPVIPSVPTNLTCYMLAERASTWLGEI